MYLYPIFVDYPSFILRQIATQFFYFIGVAFIVWVINLLYMRNLKQATQKVFSPKILIVIILLTLLLIGIHQYNLIKELILYQSPM